MDLTAGGTARVHKAPKARQILHPIPPANLQALLPDLGGYEVSYSCLSHLVITHCHYASHPACVCVCVRECVCVCVRLEPGSSM